MLSPLRVLEPLESLTLPDAPDAPPSPAKADVRGVREDADRLRADLEPVLKPSL